MKNKKILLIPLFILVFLGIINRAFAVDPDGKYFYTDILTLDNYDVAKKYGFFQFEEEPACTTSWQKRVDEIYITTNYYNIGKITPCFISETIPTKTEFQAKFKDYGTFESSEPFYYFTYLKEGVVAGFKSRIVSMGYKTKQYCLNGKTQTMISSYELEEDCTPYKKPPIKAGDVTYESTRTEDATDVPAINALGYNEEYNLLAPLPGLEKVTNDQGIGDYFNIIFKIIIGICGVLAVVMIVVGGIQYMLEESVFSKAEAKNRIISAIGGLILALGAWALLNTINPDLLGKEGSFSVKDVKLTLGASPESNKKFEPIDKNILQSMGIICNEEGGKSQLKSISESFINKATYNQDKRNKFDRDIPTVYFDCSSFVKQVYKCAGLSIKGDNTGTMFPNTEKITKIEGTKVFSDLFTNGKELEIGDLVGWMQGESDNETYKNSGHIMMYVGNGKLIDSHSPKDLLNKSVGPVWDLSNYKQEFKHIIRISPEQSSSFKATWDSSKKIITVKVSDSTIKEYTLTLRDDGLVITTNKSPLFQITKSDKNLILDPSTNSDLKKVFDSQKGKKLYMRISVNGQLVYGPVYIIP